MKKYEKKVTENENNKILTEKVIRETVFAILTEILKLKLPQKTAIKVVSSIVFASKIYKIQTKKQP